MTFKEVIETVVDAAFKERPHATAIIFARPEMREFAKEQCGINIEDLEWWSTALQDYRVTRGTKYRMTAEGYGSAAQWRVISKANHPAIHRLAQAQEHYRWVVKDAIERERKDLDYEVLPALRHNHEKQSTLDQLIAEFQVYSMNRLESTGMDRPEAVEWLAPVVAELKQRWAS